MPPLKPIKGSLKDHILMVLYMVFNGEIQEEINGLLTSINGETTFWGAGRGGHSRASLGRR